MDLIKAHGRFISILLVLGIILWYADGKLGEMSQSLNNNLRQATATYTPAYTLVFKHSKKYDGHPGTTVLLKLGGQTKLAEDLETGRAKLMEFKTDSRYTLNELPESADEGDKITYYNTMLSRLQEELSYARYFVPSVEDDRAFGFDNNKQIEGEKVVHNLRRLDIVHEVARCIERTGVRRLEKLEFKSLHQSLKSRGVPTGIIDKAPSGSSSGGSGDFKRRAASTDKVIPYFESIGLKVTVKGTETALYNLLLEFQRPIKGDLSGRYLAVEAFKFEKLDLFEPSDDMIEAEITVVAYRVHSESDYPAETKKRIEGSRPRGNKYDRRRRR